MASKNALVIGGALGAGLLLVAFTTARPVLHRSHSEAPKSWNEASVQATYVGSQLKEVDKAHASFTLFYDLENNSEVDYRLAEGRSGVVILSRLKSDGSLSQEEPMRLSYPVFLPARQRARMAIEITKPFDWPAHDDLAYDERLRNFVRQRLTNVGEFVLFDEASRLQFRLPGAWEELQEATASE